MVSEVAVAPPATSDAALDVSVAGAQVIVRTTATEMLALTPEAAAQSAERLWEAAEQARRAAGEGAGDDRRQPPFPPAELVSPHAGG